jgi:hypothetical protein
VAFFNETSDCNIEIFDSGRTRETSAAFTRIFPFVNGAAITRERLSISVVLKTFQFPEHMTVMVLSMEHAKI